MHRAIIIDDEPLAAGIVETYLKDFPEIELVGVCHNGFEGAKLISKESPDLIFLDIQMPKISGFEMLEVVDPIPAVIFTTAFEEHALRAFEANAIDYLLKPFDKERFEKAIRKYLSNSEQMKAETQAFAKKAPELGGNRIVLRDGGKIRILPLKEIILLEADDDYVQIKTDAGKFIKKQTLKHYESSLPSDQFVRVHRSFIVNISHITRIDPYEKHSHVAILKNGTRVSVSQSGYNKLKAVLGL